MRTLRTAGVLALAPFLMLATTACGNLTAGGFGEVTVAVSGDKDEPAPAPQGAPRMALLAAPATPPAPTSHEVDGDIEVDFLLYLVSETGSVLQLGDGELEIEVELTGETEFDAIDRQLVPAARYAELQIVFTAIHAVVEGLIVDGQPIPTVDVDIEDVSLLVTRSIDLEVGARAHVRLVVDLNALTWIEAVDPLTLTVDEAVFAALIDVVVE
ncbi:MAG TPA: hypothetical protein VML54_06965 [Candidatus Limnocylindrales bacterium]|nr:hypothetical protein [Candidatus Limnocylindrales bacterium]